MGMFKEYNEAVPWKPLATAPRDGSKFGVRFRNPHDAPKIAVWPDGQQYPRGPKNGGVYDSAQGWCTLAEAAEVEAMDGPSRRARAKELHS